jgi:YVTN family beta-propeller protein
MNLNYRKLLMLLTVVAMISVQSCSDDDPAPVKPGPDGFFIVNEGGFPNENTSISFYDRETDEVTNNIFAAVNGRPLGLQAQSMAVVEDKAYIMVQGTGKIEVIDADEYTSIATITDDIENPRYLVAVSSTKAYVSDWGADGLTGTVKVLDLTMNEVTKTIPTGQGANRMLKVGNVVYVTNAGGYGYDNTVKVIDTNADAVTATITVGDNPNSIQRDAAGNIWVASSGAVAYNPDFSIDEANSTKGSISKIASNNTESLRLEVNAVTYGGAGDLSISPNGQTLYYSFNGGVYSMGTTATSLPTSTFLTKSYYGFNVDPFNGNLIGALAPNFSSAGSIEVMDEDGTVLDTYTVGIGPNGVAFK